MQEITIDIQEEIDYLKSFGEEIYALENTPSELGSIVDFINLINIGSENIDNIKMTCHNVSISIDNIMKDYNKEYFNIEIYGDKTSMKSNFTNNRIKQFPTIYTYTQQISLIELKEELNILSLIDNSYIKSKYIMFLIPYCNSVDYGNYYEDNKDINYTKEELEELKFLKARFFIPNKNTILELNKDRFAI